MQWFVIQNAHTTDRRPLFRSQLLSSQRHLFLFLRIVNTLVSDGYQSCRLTMPPPEHFEAVAKILKTSTDQAVSDHGADPQETLLRPATHSVTHSWFNRLLPAEHLEAIEARWHMGNYVIERDAGVKHFEEMSIYVRAGMHLLYYGAEEEKALQWKRVVELLKDESLKMGRSYDSPASREHIQPFIASFKLQDTLAELAEPDPDKYACFNEFFSRALRDGTRPVQGLEDPAVVSCPADCRLTAYPTVDLATRYWIKGAGFTLSRLLGGNDPLAASFDGGTIVIARLAPQDYHRWHSPIDGTVEKVVDIPGAYYTVNPQAINESGVMDVFCENKRSVMLCKRKTTGNPVAIIAVGAMLVGSIVYHGGVDKPGAEIRRGECLGSFRYGGSTVIVVFPKGEVALDGDLVKNSTDDKCETLMQVAWRIGAGPA